MLEKHVYPEVADTGRHRFRFPGFAAAICAVIIIIVGVGTPAGGEKDLRTPEPGRASLARFAPPPSGDGLAAEANAAYELAIKERRLHVIVSAAGTKLSLGPLLKEFSYNMTFEQLYRAASLQGPEQIRSLLHKIGLNDKLIDSLPKDQSPEAALSLSYALANRANVETDNDELELLALLVPGSAGKRPDRTLIPPVLRVLSAACLVRYFEKTDLPNLSG